MFHRSLLPPLFVFAYHARRQLSRVFFSSLAPHFRLRIADRCPMRRKRSGTTCCLETGHISLFRLLVSPAQVCKSFNAEQDVRRTL